MEAAFDFFGVTFKSFHVAWKFFHASLDFSNATFDFSEMAFDFFEVTFDRFLEASQSREEDFDKSEATRNYFEAALDKSKMTRKKSKAALEHFLASFELCLVSDHLSSVSTTSGQRLGRTEVLHSREVLRPAHFPRLLPDLAGNKVAETRTRRTARLQASPLSPPL